jgi:predicted DNA-binding WGR domain protein
MDDTHEILLHRVDHTLNMARFYALSVEPDLFGGLALVRDWGRIGTRGRRKVELFDDAGVAAQAFERLAGRKLRKGYYGAVSKQMPISRDPLASARRDAG